MPPSRSHLATVVMQGDARAVSRLAEEAIAVVLQHASSGPYALGPSDAAAVGMASTACRGACRDLYRPESVRLDLNALQGRPEAEKSAKEWLLPRCSAARLIDLDIDSFTQDFGAFIAQAPCINQELAIWATGR